MSYEFSSPFGEGAESTMQVWSSRRTSTLTGYGEVPTATDGEVWLHVIYVDGSGRSTGYTLTFDGQTATNSVRCGCARMEVPAGDIDFVVRSELEDQAVEAQFKLRGGELALATTVPVPQPPVPVLQTTVPVLQTTVPVPQLPVLAEQLAFDILVKELSLDTAAVRFAASGDAEAHRSDGYSLRFVPESGVSVGDCPLLGAMLEVPEQCIVTKDAELTAFPDTVGQLEVLIDGLVVQSYAAALSLSD